MKCYHVIMLLLYIDKSRLQGIPQCFYRIYPKNFLSWEFSISMKNMVSYDLVLFMFKKMKPRPEEQTPFLVFRRDHLRSASGIICGSGSFAVQFGDHFRSGDHLRSRIICGAVQLYVRIWSPIQIVGNLRLKTTVERLRLDE